MNGIATDARPGPINSIESFEAGKLNPSQRELQSIRTERRSAVDDDASFQSSRPTCNPAIVLVQLGRPLDLLPWFYATEMQGLISMR